VSKPDTCIGCPLYDSPHAPEIVWGEGPQPAQLLIVGEAPGAEEQATLRPFVGGAGRVLSVQLRQAGIDRSAAYVTNAVKCRPVVMVNKYGTPQPENRPPTEDELRHCARYLAHELDTVKPNLVLALGNTPLYVLTGRTKISQQRGVPLAAPRADGTIQKVFATIHPAAIMRDQEMWPVVIHDLVRAKAETASPTIHRVEVQLVTDADPLVAGANLLERARRTGVVNIDIETTGTSGGLAGALDPRTNIIVCAAAATGPDLGESYRWTPEAAGVFRALLADPHIEKEGQNSEQFDWEVFIAKGYLVNGRTFDTMQAAHLLNSSLPKDLGFLMTLYTDMEYHKNEARKNLYLYNAKDAVGARRIGIEQRQELRYYGLEELYYNIVQPVQRPLRQMTRVGWRKDTRRAAMYSLLLTRKSEEYTQKLIGVFGPALNLDSPQQLMSILYDKLGLPVQYTKDQKTRQMRPTANKEALDNLAELTQDPIFQLIHRRRSLDKARETFIEVYEDDEGFVHPEFGTSTAANGRLNSWNPNGQNIPLEYRDIYIPDSPAHVLIGADWKQVEWACAMVLSGDDTGLRLLAEGADNHTITAAECYGISTDEVLRLDREHGGTHGSPRFATKFIVYGLGYGRGAKDIAKQLNRPVSWVEQFMARFFRKYPTYALWRAWCEKQVELNACLINPWGRRRWWYTKQITEMYNFLPSSTPADMMMQAIKYTDIELPREARLWATIHDDLTICAPKDVAREAYHCLRDNMRRVWRAVRDASQYPKTVDKYFPDGWFCDVDIHIGANWKECKKGNKDLERSLLG